MPIGPWLGGADTHFANRRVNCVFPTDQELLNSEEFFD